MELYARSGPALHMGGGFLEHNIDAGWLAQIGGRSLFFDSPGIRAWTADLSLSYTFNKGKDNNTPFLLEDGILASSVRFLHRTEGTVCFGREYYLVGSAAMDTACWRVGWDGGIRWGTTRLDVDTNVIPGGFHRVNSWNYGPVIAIHSDVEIPCGCCTFLAGFRAECDDTFNNRLRQGNDQLIDVNLLMTFGLRY
jgi:hypothetical protein